MITVGINSENEIVTVGLVGDGLTEVTLPDDFLILEAYQEMQDFRLLFDNEGNVMGSTVRGFKGEIENLWNARKENISLGQELTDRELETLELGQAMTDLELRILVLEAM